MSVLPHPIGGGGDTVEAEHGVLLGAYMLTSQAVGKTRDGVRAQIDREVSRLSVRNRVERIHEAEPEELRELLSRPTTPPIVDFDVNHVSDALLQPLVRSMHLRQVSNALKHLTALRKIAALDASDGRARYALVLEDDAVFGDQMQTAVRAAIKSAPADADIIFTGLPSTRHPPQPGSPSLFDDPLVLFRDHVLPACESYLVTPAAAARIAGAFLPVFFPTNVQLTLLLRRGIVQSYVAVPNAFVDGSKVGVFTSSLDTNNQLLWNQAYCKLDALVRRGGVAGSAPTHQPYPSHQLEEQQAQFEALWKEHTFKDHPDSQVLLGDHLFRACRYKEAEAAYARALQGYDRDGCIINNCSDFLRRYMAVYRHVSTDP